MVPAGAVQAPLWNLLPRGARPHGRLAYSHEWRHPQTGGRLVVDFYLGTDVHPPCCVKRPAEPLRLV